MLFLYLSGSIKEFRSILLAAKDLKAAAIHFLSPNVVFILAGNQKDYVYAQTTITIGQSIVIPKSSYQNMHLYIKATRKAYSNPTSPFYLETISSVLFTPGKVKFNHSDLLSIVADIPTFPLKKEVESKINDSIQSSFTVDTPFLNLPMAQASQIHSALLDNKRRYVDKARKSADNAIRIQGGQVLLFSKHDEKMLKMNTHISDYSTNQVFRNVSYTFTDKAFYLFRWLAQTSPIKEFTIIPRDQYCVIEGYDKDLRIKVRTGIRNDLPG
ncbi:hypothetical protein [Priestia megaterium]|uniref:hypothetical protein n=1 Tax=Priestia megaterium TaxID=1404 RepID=UPI002E2357B8|nr:hypothetical protein [Priestia megaterium]